MIVREAADRIYFVACAALGRLLRSARYSEAQIVSERGESRVRKRRRLYAPLLIWLAARLHRIIGTGVRMLPQRDWEQRERELYARVYGASVRIDADGTLVLPFLAGTTLADLLEDPALGESARRRAIELAVVALAELHAGGFTHGDAMAENVMVDLESGVARWFDFETMHEPSRPMEWRCADDVRALVATCVLRTEPGEIGGSLQRVMDVYADEELTGLLATSFSSAFRRPLPFHLGQAGLSFPVFREIGRLLRKRVGERPVFRGSGTLPSI